MLSYSFRSRSPRVTVKLMRSWCRCTEVRIIRLSRSKSPPWKFSTSDSHTICYILMVDWSRRGQPLWVTAASVSTSTGRSCQDPVEYGSGWTACLIVCHYTKIFENTIFSLLLLRLSQALLPQAENVQRKFDWALYTEPFVQYRLQYRLLPK